MTYSALDATYMARALQLARYGLYTAAPNPCVGCVIVAAGEVVGEGWHVSAGTPHAEVHALAQAGDKARGATAYVTLEPCAHQGRTGPCAQALIAAGVSKVIAALIDPNPLVSGAGMAALRAAGVECHDGLQRAEAENLMRGFLSRMRRARPFITLKSAASLDGRTSLHNGASKWITGPAARTDVQRLRARSQAIISGSGTVLADNARLTVRHADIQYDPLVSRVHLRQPLRVILDSAARVPADAHVCNDEAPTLLVHRALDRQPVFPTVERIALPDAGAGIDLPALCLELGRRGINEALLECGPRLAGAFIQAGLVDEWVLYLAPVVLGSDARALLNTDLLTSLSDASRWQWSDVRQVGNDLRVTLRPVSH